jgi:glycosyltransferase involved in cell wall biosynthesis
MKKVLILAYDFPPYVSVGGLRPKAWLDHFKSQDLEPIVITRQWSNKHGNFLDYVDKGESNSTLIENLPEGTIIKSAYQPNLSNRLLLKYGENRFRLIRKILTAYFEIFQFILPIGTKRGLYQAANEYLSKNKVDCIIATGDPFVLFKYAKQLSSKYQTPWIADYRDPWSHDYENNGTFFEKKWNRFWEKRIVSSANAVVTVSDLLKVKIEDLTLQKNIRIIPNGYDSEAMAKVKEIKQNSDLLRIGFAGSIFFWNPIDSFLETMVSFIKTNPNQLIELHFYGVNIKDELKDKIVSKYPELLDSTFIFPRIPNPELLEKLAACNVLLLFNHFSILGTKIFDYMGLKRKILLCFTADKKAEELKSTYFPLKAVESQSNKLQEELIKLTNSGVAIINSAHLGQVLAELAQEFAINRAIQCHSKNTENYSRKIQVEKFAELIKTLC